MDVPDTTDAYELYSACMKCCHTLTFFFRVFHRIVCASFLSWDDSLARIPGRLSLGCEQFVALTLQFANAILCVPVSQSTSARVPRPSPAAPLIKIKPPVPPSAGLDPHRRAQTFTLRAFARAKSRSAARKWRFLGPEGLHFFVWTIEIISFVCVCLWLKTIFDTNDP